MRVTITIDLPDKPLPEAQAEQRQINQFWHDPIRDFAARFNSHAAEPSRRTWGMMKPFGSTIQLEEDPQ